jgi:glycosyltransferase involved in cell wall biosynthesis
MPELQRACWVAQLRGGSDLELRKFDAVAMARVVEILGKANYVVSDNRLNLQYLAAAGLDKSKFASISPVPGAGGVDLDTIQPGESPASARKFILWPKAYNTPYTQALPTLEALRLAWPHIKQFRIVLLWCVQQEVRDWVRLTCSELKANWDVRSRVDQKEVIDLLRQSRLMLAPSLVDGVPNMLYESMATGTLPIVSPLDTIKDVVTSDNVFFARNLYPEEIAAKLVEAVSDDEQIDYITARNREVVRRLASRADIRSRVAQFYEKILTELT